MRFRARCRRLLKASYWRSHLRVAWWAEDALPPLPPPKDGPRHLVGDGSEQPQRGTQHPWAQKGRKSEPHPWLFGMRFARLLANGDGYRVPGACRRMRPTNPPEDRTAKALFRARVGSGVPPTWAKRMSVEGEAAYGSREQRPMVRKREAHDPARRWGCVCAMARPWHTVAEKAIQDVVTHGPRRSAPRLRGPRLPGTKGCTTFWVSSTRLCLRHVGDVTVVLRKKGRNGGPKQTKILGTNLDEWTPRQGVCAEQRRWPVEHIHRELTTDLGLGAPQGSRDGSRNPLALRCWRLCW